jgi:hypothetical protein
MYNFLEVRGQLHAPSISGERAPCAQWIGGWVGARPGLDAVAKIKISVPWSSSPQLGHYTDRATLAHSLFLFIRTIG